MRTYHKFQIGHSVTFEPPQNPVNVNGDCTTGLLHAKHAALTGGKFIAVVVAVEELIHPFYFSNVDNRNLVKNVCKNAFNILIVEIFSPFKTTIGHINFSLFLMQI